MARRKDMTEQAKAEREGRIYAAFFRGYQDARRGHSTCPYPDGSEAARGWRAGYGWNDTEVNSAPANR